MMTNLVVNIFIFNSVVIVSCGLLYAVMAILGLRRDFFWERLAPAVAALVATSLGAGILMLGTSWLMG